MLLTHPFVDVTASNSSLLSTLVSLRAAGVLLCVVTTHNKEQGQSQTHAIVLKDL